MGAKRRRSTGMDGNHHKKRVTMGKPHSDSAKKSAPDELPRRCMCIDFQRLNVLQPAVVKVDSKAKGNLTLHPLPKIDELYAKLGGAKIFSALDLTSGYYHIELGSTS